MACHRKRTLSQTVVLHDHHIQFLRPDAERLDLRVDGQGALGHLELGQQEVLRLPQQSHERRVEVHGDVMRLFISGQQR